MQVGVQTVHPRGVTLKSECTHLRDDMTGVVFAKNDSQEQQLGKSPPIGFHLETICFRAPPFVGEAYASASCSEETGARERRCTTEHKKTQSGAEPLYIITPKSLNSTDKCV